MNNNDNKIKKIEDLDELIDPKNKQIFLLIAKAAFDGIDSDKTGEIDPKEFKRVLDMYCGNDESPSYKEIKEVFTHFDLDRSGNIGYDEFEAILKYFLKRYSSNKKEKKE